ncbi:hypothetical protein XELAEV_18014229mg [Xenopus laevis]|uniref:Uncharacterized protein n=1 Tax=Xenopus laevis TaxID=8355 RepID=A0A974HV34_XENLA|nr:hypothetical protein XELAEV_18014229mg [Xenopus laevis]
MLISPENMRLKTSLASFFIIYTLKAQITLKYSSKLLQGTLPAQTHYSNQKKASSFRVYPGLSLVSVIHCASLFSVLIAFFFCFPRLL